MKTRQETLQLLEFCRDVTDKDFVPLVENILSFYKENGYLSNKQKKVIINTINFKCLNV